MVGGRGDDLYVVDSFGDVVIEVAGEGVDEVRTSLSSYVLSANIERLRTTGTTGQSLTGNDLSNVITSGGGADTLDGGTGNDTLNGGDGDDLLLSGAGNDYLNGGDGIDVVSFDKAVSGVTVNLSLTRAQATGGAGTDAILNIEDLVGSKFSDTLTGTSGANRLEGGLGADQLFGGAGDDTLVGSVSNQVEGNRLSGGDGVDIAIYAGRIADYDVRRDGVEVRLSQVGNGATDILREIEEVRFGDGVVYLDGRNNGPTAQDDEIELKAGSNAAGSLLGNDKDFDGDRMTVANAGTHVLEHGTLTVFADGTYRYEADQAGSIPSGAVVSDTFEYVASDGRGGTSRALLTIKIEGVSPPPVLPVLQADTATTSEDASIRIDPLANDTGTGLHLVSADLGTQGGHVSIVDGQLVFDPAGAFEDLGAGESREVTIRYGVEDAHGVTGEATAVVTVTGVNDAPVVAQALTIPAATAGEAFSFTVPAGTMVDDDGGASIAYRVELAGGGSLPAWLSFDASTGILSGTAPAGAAAHLDLRLVGSEADGQSAHLDFALDVTAVAKPPIHVDANGSAIFIQRDGVVGSLSYTGDAARLLKDGHVVSDWSSTGTLTGIPQGDGYSLEVRTGSKVVASPLSVGVVVVTIGQSNMAGWFTSPTASHEPSNDLLLWKATATGGSWVAADGAGILPFGEALQQTLGGVPVAVVNGSIGGTRLVADGKSISWSDAGSGTLYQNTLDQLLKATGGRSEFAIWNQGEADAGSKVSAATYAASLNTLMNRVDAEMGNPTFLVSGLGMNANGADPIRLGQQLAVAQHGDAVYVPTSLDLELVDTAHFTSVSRAWHAIDVAYAAAMVRSVPMPEPVILAGGVSWDVLVGTLGNDRIRGDRGDDHLSGADGNDILRGQDGNDTIDGDVGNDALSGGNDHDLVIGGDGHDDVFGDAGNDTLEGGSGNDHLDGGFGSDVMDGGAGNDSYVVDALGDRVSELAADQSGDSGGVDAVTSSVSFILGDYIENLQLVGSVPMNGTGNDLANNLFGNSAANRLTGLVGDDRLVGSGGNDYLDGGDGKDRLEGGSGSDTMIGGSGDDVYLVDAIGDLVRETNNDGTDTGGIDQVQSSISYTLGDFVENLALSGTGSISGYGNALANIIAGTIGANVINGGAGSDSITGNAGNDLLFGDADNDVIRGNDGADTIYGGQGADRLTGDDNTDNVDRFVLQLASDSAEGVGNRDVIADFDVLDIIDLSAIDARNDLAGDQAFSFIGAASFSSAGQVRVSVTKAFSLVEGDIDGDGLADFQVELTFYKATMNGLDFVL